MSSLNGPQRAAVEHGDGPMLILAGAGSGKTRVITYRIASLIRRGIDPAAVVAVSFTNKAADEMAERMVPLVGRGRAGRIRMSTFHSFGLELLKQERRAAGLDGRFVVFDQGDSLGVIKEILRGRYRGGAPRRYDPMALLSRISNWKSAMVAAADVAESPCEYDGVAREVYPEYDERLRAMRALDFDDLVCRPVRLLRDRPQTRERWRRRIEHLLVDEFQDTSAVQLELVKLLANDRRNVCVVGDDDQSIYSWRGADPTNILQFETHFPGAKLIKLETNYRSRAPILEVANAVIARSGAGRYEKTLRSAREGGDAVRACALDDPPAEARFVAREIVQLRDEGRSLEDIAVLYRSNKQARLIEEALTEARVAHRVFGGQQFFDRKEVKDTAAYLRFVVNPWDEISLRRIINYPARGVGTRSVARIEAFALAHGTSFVKAFERCETIDGLPDGARHGLRRLRTVLDDARTRLRAGDKLFAVARDLIDRVELRAALDDSGEGGNEGTHRYGNVLALIGWIERYEKSGDRSAKSLQDFLQRVALNGDRSTEEPSGPGVTLSTLHAAKGLEFGVVFLIGCIEGQLPHTRTTDPRASEASTPDLEEERRLFYVGITRARDRLYLTSPRRRVLRGKTVDVTPSRYMDELPEGHVESYERPEQREMSRGEFASSIRDLLRKHRKEPATAES